MKLSDFYPQMKGWTPAMEESSVARTPQVPNEQTQVSPFLRTVLPLPLQYSGDTIKQYNRPGISSFRTPPLPPSGIPAINSTSAGVTKVINQSSGSGVLLETNSVPNASQSVLNIISGSNITLTPDSSGGVTIAGTAGGDGLVHGTTPWEIDPSAVIWNEDFITARIPGNGPNTSPFLGSSTAWSEYGSASAIANIQSFNQFPSHVGVNQWYNAGAANAVAIFTPTNAGSSTFGVQGAQQNLLPLLDYPGWKATWVFMFSKAWACGQSPTSAAFSVATTMTYVGFSAGYGAVSASLATFNGFRPNIFLGLRYDTDPGQSGLSVTAVSAPVSGIATYTGTFPLGASGYYIGNSITIAGCAAGNNNGTFICTGSTATTLSLINPAATAAGGQTATASCPGISDTTMKFEWVANPFNGTSVSNLSRNNTQGTVVDTTLVPTENVWYRLDMQSTVAGQVTLTLSGGGHQFSSTMTCSKVTLGDTSNGLSFNWFQGNGWVNANLGSVAYNGTDAMSAPWSVGSILTLTNPPTGMGTGPFVTYGGGSSGNSIIFPFTPAITTGNKNTTFTGYPALWPTFWSGNDSTSGFPTAGRAWNLDFFGLAYNPGLAGATVDTKQSRYFSGT